MPDDPNAPQPAAGPNPGVSVATFSGLKNTVSPESLTARELARARNIDLDDIGQAHRRRGRRQVAGGRWHSVYTTADGVVFGIQNGSLVLVFRDYTSLIIMPGVSDAPLSWVEAGDTLYAVSIHNSFSIHVPTLAVAPWGVVQGHTYQPGLDYGPEDFWYSPVVAPEEGLPPVAGRLLGAPPLGQAAVLYNGRIYVAAGPVLWATELFMFAYVDKTKGYRQYESDITGLCAVEDGIYVGTTRGLYFVSGNWGEEKRSPREICRVLPGSMRNVPGALVDPEGRRFPDLPRATSRAMACMTDEGVVVGLGGGQTYNLTQKQFLFPEATRADTLYREEDGMNTWVATLKSPGTPSANARFGDHLEATLIRAGTPGQPGPRSP